MKRIVPPMEGEYTDGSGKAGTDGKVSGHSPSDTASRAGQPRDPEEANDAEATLPGRNAGAVSRAGMRHDTPDVPRRLVPPEFEHGLNESVEVGLAFGRPALASFQASSTRPADMLTGVAGSVVGYGVGLYKMPINPYLWGAVTGAQWATLSSTFWGEPDREARIASLCV